MSYKVYELVKPEILKKTEIDDYDMKTTELITLKDMSWECGLLSSSYVSESEAQADIVANKDRLKHKDLVVLNVMSVDWEGEIS